MFAAMRIINYYKYFSFFLIILSISSFFIGFIYGENSAGAGTFNGDFKFLSEKEIIYTTATTIYINT